MCMVLPTSAVACLHIAAHPVEVRGPHPTKICLWGLLWFGPHENFTKINFRNKNQQNRHRKRLWKLMKRSKSRGRRGFASDSTGAAVLALPIPLTDGEGNMPSQKTSPLLALRASIFSPSGLAISVDPHPVVDGLAPMAAFIKWHRATQVATPR